MFTAHAGLLAFIYLAFISLGLPDGVLGVAWPAMRVDLQQPLASAGLVSMLVTGCAAVSGFMSARVLRLLGTGPVVVLSGVLTGGALLGFAYAPAFGWILLLALPLGFGAGAVDAGLNHFVARHYSARHMNWLHGCWGIGATLGPLVMGAALAQPQGWQAGYRMLGLAQLALTGVFLLTLGLWRREDARPAPVSEEVGAAAAASSRAAVPYWARWLAPSLFLPYALIEVGTGLWVASVLIDDRGLDAQRAGVWMSCYYGSIVVGRFAIGLVTHHLSNRALVQGGLGIALLGALLVAIPTLPAPAWLMGIVLMGLGCSPVYPSLMHETTRRFDPELARVTVGRQVAFASTGSALGPAALGVLGAGMGLWAIMPAVCVAVLLLLWMCRRLDRVT